MAMNVVIGNNGCIYTLIQGDALNKLYYLKYIIGSSSNAQIA